MATAPLESIEKDRKNISTEAKLAVEAVATDTQQLAVPTGMMNRIIEFLCIVLAISISTKPYFP